MAEDAREGKKMNYSEMYQRVKGKRCGLRELSVEGLQRTRERVVSRELEALKEAGSVEEMKDVLVAATSRLKELGIFDEVAMRLDAGEMGDDKDKADTADVHVQLRESNLFKVHAGTYVNQNSEGSLEASVALKNGLGWAERVEASFEYGSSNSSEYCLSYIQPRLFDSTSQIQSRIFRTRENNQRHCSFTEDMNGASVTVSSESGAHELTVDGGWQAISDRSKMASRAILQQMGHRMRATAAYTWRHQRLLQPEAEGLPRVLLGVKTTTQLGAVSPMGGAVGFAKQVLSGAIILPLSESADLTFCAKVGALIPLGDRSGATPSCITDRFFLGGVSSLRGFRTRGVGPTDERRPEGDEKKTDEAAPSDVIPDGPPTQRDALGGDLMCTLFAEYNFPLPHPVLQALDAKGHVFVNGGNVTLLDGGKPLKPKLMELAKTFRLSAGAGIYIPTALGRFEVNYCRVLTSQLHDRPKHGMQFGFMSGLH